MRENIVYPVRGDNNRRPAAVFDCSSCLHLLQGSCAVIMLVRRPSLALLTRTASLFRTQTRLSATFSPQSTSSLSVKPLGEVVRSWTVFRLLSFDWIVANSLTLYNVSRRILGDGITRRLLRVSVGGQFLGGFSEDEAESVAELIALRRLCSVWNFSTEQDITEAGDKEGRYDEVNDRYLESISLSGVYNYQESPVKLAAVKLTAIVDPQILLKLSQMLEAVQRPLQGLDELTEEGERKRVEVAKLMSSFKVAEDLSVLENASKSQIPEWTLAEKIQLNKLIERLDMIGERAVREDVRILVDAEESRMQPAIHHLAVNHMMPRFNQKAPFIYNTIQMYRKHSLSDLLVDITTAKTSGFYYAAKVVRGAYMYYEKEVAEKTGREYPIHPTKEATDENYNRGIQCMLKELAPSEETGGGGGGALVVATHNRTSVELALQTMKELGIPRNNGAVCFGQQLGMADYIAYALAEEGYFVQKILAYGEERDVIPFLVRRAQENNKTSENAQLEMRLYGEELKRRIFGT